MYSSLNSSSVGASIPAINDHVEDFHFGDLQKPFQKWQRKDKRRYVERFCSITTPEGQNGKTKNLQFTCKCCGKKFMGQLITAMIHLSGTRKASQRISVCPTPDEEIRSEILMIFTLDQEQGEDLTNDVGGDGMLMGDAFGNGLDLQHQQAPYLQHQIPQQSHQLAKRAAAKRKRETAPLSTKAMSVNPSDPTDMAILNFFSQCGVRPDHVEHPAFITMARALRAAPKNYALPVLNRHANSAHNPYPPANNMLAARNSINNNHEGNGNGNGNNINNMLNSGAGPGPSNSSGSSSSGGGEMGVYGGMNNAASVPTYEDHHAHMSTGAEDGGTGGEGGEGDVGGDGEGGEEEGDVDSSDSEDNSTQPENLM